MLQNFCYETSEDNRCQSMKSSVFIQQQVWTTFHRNLNWLPVLKKAIQDSCKSKMKFCVLLSLLLSLFSLAHIHSLSGHLGIYETFKDTRQNFFWPGRYMWIVDLIGDCIECQTNKTKKHDLHVAPMEQSGKLETTPFKIIHIDHKGPILPSSNLITHCFVVVDAFSRFLEPILSETQERTTKSTH